MLAREKTLQAVILTIKNKYGKNAILKGHFFWTALLLPNVSFKLEER